MVTCFIIQLIVEVLRRGLGRALSVAWGENQLSLLLQGTAPPIATLFFWRFGWESSVEWIGKSINTVAIS